MFTIGARSRLDGMQSLIELKASQPCMCGPWIALKPHCMVERLRYLARSEWHRLPGCKLFCTPGVNCLIASHLIRESPCKACSDSPCLCCGGFTFRGLSAAGKAQWPIIVHRFNGAWCWSMDLIARDPRTQNKPSCDCITQSLLTMPHWHVQPLDGRGGTTNWNLAASRPMKSNWQAAGKGMCGPSVQGMPIYGLQTGACL